MNLESIAEYLNAQGLGVPGQTVFVHKMPAEVKEGILLLSSLSGTQIDYELPKYRKTKFQAIVRHTNHIGGKELSKQVMNALTLYNHNLTGMKVKRIRPRHEPIVFPVSKGNLLEFSVNYDAIYVLT